LRLVMGGPVFKIVDLWLQDSTQLTYPWLEGGVSLASGYWGYMYMHSAHLGQDCCSRLEWAELCWVYVSIASLIKISSGHSFIIKLISIKFFRSIWEIDGQMSWDGCLTESLNIFSECYIDCSYLFICLLQSICC
jgi:hypothetical protein